ncbi:unnamed protein product [Cyprideis torosa]|uniref:glycine--tRNA ligase n=1 Tax=Cyprideis torosa TaxID=163714 RepID=A0A7R8WHD7_9CRUS|nr:unnamed protein product [Cyprideis torosa]CAG0893172.1 unnamed protein product [Cyprideis torosa]
MTVEEQVNVINKESHDMSLCLSQEERKKGRGPLLVSQPLTPLKPKEAAKEAEESVIIMEDEEPAVEDASVTEEHSVTNPKKSESVESTSDYMSDTESEGGTVRKRKSSLTETELLAGSTVSDMEMTEEDERRLLEEVPSPARTTTSRTTTSAVVHRLSNVTMSDIEGTVRGRRSSGSSQGTTFTSGTVGSEKTKRRNDQRRRKKERERALEAARGVANRPSSESRISHTVGSKPTGSSKGELVRKLKETGAPDLDILSAVQELKHRKKALEEEIAKVAPKEPEFNRVKMEELLKRRFFFMQSFAIYGGVAGLFDLGPMGCAMKANILHEWRQFFILEEGMLEIDCPVLTPEPVLMASGHVERFSDFMVKDVKSGECFRLDHLIKANLEKISVDKKTDSSLKDECRDMLNKLDGMNVEEMTAILRRFAMKSPTTGSEVSDPCEFNLMFGTQIGPSGDHKGYLRPETAQGMFVNFKKLLEFNQGRLPFAAAQIGDAFRNEISPRSGLIRVREFTMAEIEHFCDPLDKSHPKFSSVSDVLLTLYSACDQMDGNPPKQIPIGEAVKSGLVANETLGYFIVRIYQFLIRVGVDPLRLRFRQHMSNEMAHYACDCWDAEIKTSYGWVECVGCADRSAFDLTQHSKASNTRLYAERKLAEPRTETRMTILPNKAVIGKTFQKDASVLIGKLRAMEQEEVRFLAKEMEVNGEAPVDLGRLGNAAKVFRVTKDMVSFKEAEEKVFVDEFVPSVIEPSFGIGRIMYSILEHNFRTREDDDLRGFFTLPPTIAPVKCSVLPLSGNDEFVPYIKQIRDSLRYAGVSHRVDDSSGSIGRRYARTDEIAIPFGVTVDFDTVNIKPPSVTLRERDSTQQVRIPIAELAETVRDLSDGKLSWKDVEGKYPKFEAQKSEEDRKKAKGEK